VSVSGGGGTSSSDVAWVSEQSGFHAKDKLDVRVEKHTQLNGAVLASDTGQLTLDTGTFGFTDIRDHDTGTSLSGQVGASYTAEYEKTGYDANGNLVSHEAGGGPGVNLSGSYASHDIEQTTRATVGEGTIVIRDKGKQKQDVAEINRDVAQSQVVTKNEREGVNVRKCLCV
jgi:filamentous hemagglutinin